LFAVRAPIGASLEVPDPEQGSVLGKRKYEIHLSNRNMNGPIDVFLIQDLANEDYEGTLYVNNSNFDTNLPLVGQSSALLSGFPKDKNIPQAKTPEPELSHYSKANLAKMMDMPLTLEPQYDFSMQNNEGPFDMYPMSEACISSHHHSHSHSAMRHEGFLTEYPDHGNAATMTGAMQNENDPNNIFYDQNNCGPFSDSQLLTMQKYLDLTGGAHLE
jgi:hypothetical protein